MVEVLAFPKQVATHVVRNSYLPQIAIIVPTLNEAESLPALLAALTISLAELRYEILVVDDWSTDGTPDIVAEIARCNPHLRLIRRFGRRGLSSAVIEGALATQASIIAVMDADMQHDERLLPALIDLVATDRNDLAIGSRYVDGGSCQGFNKRRKLVSRASTRIAKATLGFEVHDPMSGFFAMRRDRFLDIVPCLSGKGFKLLFDILSASPGLRIAEVPYAFRARELGQSKLRGSVALAYAGSVVRGAIGRYPAARLTAYGAVGLLGLLVHISMLEFLLGPGRASFVHAQCGAVITAIAFNFTLNNRLTFRDRTLTGRNFYKGLISFYAICGLGALANVGVGSLLYAGRQQWWVAGMAGALVGSFWNFLASAAITWRRA